MESEFKLPAWLDAMPHSEQARARAKVIVHIAAAFASPGGTVDALSLAMGYRGRTVVSALNQGRYDKAFPVDFIMRLEDAIGRGTIPREIMNPEVFGPATRD